MGGRGGVFTFAKKGQGYWRFASGLILGPVPSALHWNTLVSETLEAWRIKKRDLQTGD